jgi:hypothetical protein
MNRNLSICMAALGAAVLLAGSAGDAGARPRSGGWFEYAVPFTCGLNGGDIERAVPGLYAAAVSIHNGSAIEVMFTKHVALTFPPEAQAPGDVSDVLVETLLAGTALQVDCGEILGGDFTFPGGVPASPYVQGFLVILAHAELGVSATHTASAETGEVSVDVETVLGRAVPGPEGDHQKMDVCHVPKNRRQNAHTLNVSMAAVPAHLAHGDSLGACE